MYTENPQHGWGFQKALAMPSPTAAESLPLMRADFPVSGENVCKADKRGLEVDSPLGENGGRETSSANSLPQSFASQKPAPSSEGAFGAHLTASAVVVMI